MPAQQLLCCFQEQVEAARKDIDQAKDEVVFKLPEDEDENYLIEEGSSKKSKKAKGPNRLALERTGTRMSERLRSTRIPPRDGSSGDVESPQARLPNLRHPRAVTTEEDDGLPQVAQHTRGAAVRRELVREEKSAQVFPNTRRTVARREEAWTKSPSAGERVQKIAPHRTEAPSSGDRVLRNNPQRTEIPSVGDKLPQVTPHKPDPGATGDRVIKSSPPKTEAQIASDTLRQSPRQAMDSSLDKVLRGGAQKPEKPSALVNLQSSSPRCEATISDTQALQLHAEVLDGKALKLKGGTVSQEQEETPQLSSSPPKLQTTNNAPSVQVPTQVGLMTTKLLDTGTPSDVVGIPAPKEKVPNPVPVVAAQDLPCESKPEGAPETGIALSEQKEAQPKPDEDAEMSAEQALLNSSGLADRQEEAIQEVTLLGCVDKLAKGLDAFTSSEDILPQATDGAASMLDSKKPQMEMLILASAEHSTTVASSLLQPESPPFAKEQNGLGQPPRTGDLLCPVSELRGEISPLQMALPTPEATSSEANSFSESPKLSQGVVEKKLHEDDQQNKETKTSAISPGTVASQESSPGSVTSPGALFSDESLSPIKAPRRRTSADVQIRQSCQDQDGPAAKVLRKLPGRLVTVVEEKELIRRRRNRMRKLDAANSATGGASNSSAPSVSESETSPSGKELPLLRDLPARRRIELESRAAAKEKDEGSRAEGLLSPSTEPVKRKRGRPPKNKSPEQPSQGFFQSLLEPTLETSLQGKAPEPMLPETLPHSKTSEDKAAKTQPHSKTSDDKVAKTQPHSKTSDDKVAKTQPHSKTSDDKVAKTQPHSKTSDDKVAKTQPHSKTSDDKVAKTQPHSKTSDDKVLKTRPHSKTSEGKASQTSTPKNKSPKTKTESSENDSPVEKRRRGRPPKVRESPIRAPKPSASEMLQVSAAKPPTTELSTEVQKSPAPVSIVEAASKVHESLEVNPKITSVSKTSPKAQSRAPTPPKSRSVSKSTPKAQELLSISPKLLSKSSTEACEPLSSSPRTLSGIETSPEAKEPSSPASVPHTPPKAFTTAESPPKRKRGRPPKNSPSPYLEAAAPPASASEQETTLEKKAPVPPVRKRRRRRRKDELGPSLPGVNQSSSEGEDTRPLTRLALLKREEKVDSCTEGLTRTSPKDVLAEGLSSAESSTWEQQSSDTPTRSTRLRPGSLVPPLEWETQRRKRRCSLEGSQVSNSSKSPAPQASLEQEGGESESSLRSSSESNSSKGTRQPKRQCCESEGRGRGRGRRHHSPANMADRILRSAAKPADNTRSVSSPAPTRKAGPASASTSAGGVAGLPSPSTAASPAATVTSSLSNRGRKPKT